jgi:hypothetical protein
MPFDGLYTPRFKTADQIAEYHIIGSEIADKLRREELRESSARGVWGSRWRTHDNNAMLTYDGLGGRPTFDASLNMMGKYLDRGYRAHDGNTYDSTGAFYLGELVRLDQTTHLPLAAVSWGRDIDLRQDVTSGDDGTSWTLTTFGGPGGLGMTNAITGGKAWVGKDTTEIASVGVDMGLITKPLHPWALELKYTVFELESALRLGRPIDQQKYLGLQMRYQMEVDAQCYVGDSDTGDVGLVNSPLAATGLPGAGIITNVPAGAGTGNPTGWMQGKTPAEILADFNFALNQVWQNSAWAVVPERVLLPTAQYGYIATELVSTAGTTSILRYVEENNLLSRSGQGKLQILPLKWCNGAGAGGTIGTPAPGANDRMVVYTKRPELIRLALTLLQRTPIQYDGIWQKTSYWGKLGVIEIVYPEVLGYFDKI